MSHDWSDNFFVEFIWFYFRSFSCKKVFVCVWVLMAIVVQLGSTVSPLRQCTDICK